MPLEEKGFPVKGIGSTVKWDAEKSKQMFQALREDRPLAPHLPKQPKATLVDVAPEQIRVQVYNGTPKDGLGQDVDEALRATGFNTTRAPLNGGPHDLRRTLVTYDPRWDRSAKSWPPRCPAASSGRCRGRAGP